MPGPARAKQWRETGTQQLTLMKGQGGITGEMAESGAPGLAGLPAPLLSSYFCGLERLLNLSAPCAPVWEAGLRHK